MVARSVLKAVLPDIPHDEVDYNVVQNNGKLIHHRPLQIKIVLATSTETMSSTSTHDHVGYHHCHI